MSFCLLYLVYRVTDLCTSDKQQKCSFHAFFHFFFNLIHYSIWKQSNPPGLLRSLSESLWETACRTSHSSCCNLNSAWRRICTKRAHSRSRSESLWREKKIFQALFCGFNQACNYSLVEKKRKDGEKRDTSCVLPFSNVLQLQKTIFRGEKKWLNGKRANESVTIWWRTTD